MTSRILGSAGRFLITTGVVVLAFVAYQLWGTGLQEAAAQGELESEFDELLGSFEAIPPPETTSSTSSTTPDATSSSTSTSTTTTTLPQAGGTIPISDEALAAALFRDGGEAIARIIIPRMDLDKVVVQGVKVEDLRNGPGHYQSTVFPGQQGNSGIAGHRTTYGAPFGRIDELLPGDSIRVETVQGVHTYRVMTAEAAFGAASDDPNIDFSIPEGDEQLGHIIVDPNAVWVLDDFGDNRITLTACDPKYSAARRIIVAAELITEPVDAPPPPPDLANTGGPSLASEFDDGLDAGQASSVATTEAPFVTDEPADESATGRESPFDRSLDEGLKGDKDALFPALGWGAATMAAWFGFKELSRRWKRWPAIALGVAPVTLLLGLSFEKIDRYLPAG